MRLAANPGVVRFAQDWVKVQRDKMLEALGGAFNNMDPLHRPHDQVLWGLARPWFTKTFLDGPVVSDIFADQLAAGLGLKLKRTVYVVRGGHCFSSCCCHRSPPVIWLKVGLDRVW